MKKSIPAVFAALSIFAVTSAYAIEEAAEAPMAAVFIQTTDGKKVKATVSKEDAKMLQKHNGKDVKLLVLH